MQQQLPSLAQGPRCSTRPDRARRGGRAQPILGTRAQITPVHAVQPLASQGLRKLTSIISCRAEELGQLGLIMQNQPAQHLTEAMR